MKIDIICVGKLKEKYLKDAVGEYLKRLSSYSKVQIHEVPDEKTKEGGSESENDRVLMTEAERILKYIDEDACVITLEINAKQQSSEEFAQSLNDLFISGKSHIQFVIGGSLGLHQTVTKRGDVHLSFSKFTFPHQLMRVILLEQIYRAMKIIKNEPYHK
ncbi:MAG: 23S rRNA (pseudouridine(1915)-N(3))-methyltransferase RlmH [Lachnospiraceae bacterium]|nr:23S rRNA (pseudouridine(1915)-N(3))-methyltransferase RlmH [Lachnospiraceae bacterium]